MFGFKNGVINSAESFNILKLILTLLTALLAFKTAESKREKWQENNHVVLFVVKAMLNLFNTFVGVSNYEGGKATSYKRQSPILPRDYTARIRHSRET